MSLRECVKYNISSLNICITLIHQKRNMCVEMHKCHVYNYFMLFYIHVETFLTKTKQYGHTNLKKKTLMHVRAKVSLIELIYVLYLFVWM